MTSILLIEESPAETRAALVVGDALHGLWFSGEEVIGGTYLGKIGRIDKKLAAAFVDIGIGQDGFLPLRDNPVVSEGASILVQIKRPANAGKGALLTANVTPDVSLRAKIESEQPPARLDLETHPAISAFSHFAARGLQQVLVAGTESFLALQQHVSGLTDEDTVAVEQDQSDNLFEHKGIEEAVEQALSRTINLPEGGRLVFDEVEALTAVDVDVAATPGQSKRGSIIKACSAAIPEILRQLRLRRIGGQVVIDFPALAVKGGGQIQSLLKKHVKPMTGGRLGRIDDNGLATLILPRKQATLLDLLTEHFGAGPIQGRRLTANTISASCLRQAETALKQNPSAKIEVRAAAEVTDLITANPDWTTNLTKRYGLRLKLTAQENTARETFDVREV